MVVGCEPRESRQRAGRSASRSEVWGGRPRGGRQLWGWLGGMALGLQGHREPYPVAGLGGGVALDKAALRSAAQQTLASLGPRVRAQEEELVNAAIQASPEWHAARTVLVYKHKNPEFSVVGLTNGALRVGKRVVLPRVADRREGRLELRLLRDWADLVPGAFGIQEPRVECPLVGPGEIDLAIVPGLAWTRAGARLGWGGGFYDRLLPRLERDGCRVWGVGFDGQVVEDLPVEAHDQAVDEVWTAARVVEMLE